MPVTDCNVTGICRYYDARWGIESGYRIDDHDFTGITTSHSEAIRLFYLFLSVILRNVLTLLKSMLTDGSRGEMSSYEFCESFRSEAIGVRGAS